MKENNMKKKKNKKMLKKSMAEVINDATILFPFFVLYNSIFFSLYAFFVWAFCLDSSIFFQVKAQPNGNDITNCLAFVVSTQ